MKITLELELPLSDEDKAALRALMGEEATVAVAAAEEAKPAPAAKKATPAKKTAAAAKKAEPEPEPDEEPEAEDEDLLGGDEPTMADAVKLATELVSSGSAPKVKAALAEVGAKRVSELKESDIGTFIAALS